MSGVNPYRILAGYEKKIVHLKICPMTGGHIELSVLQDETIQSVKCKLARRLRIHQERITLLHRNRLLKNGSVQENGLCNGSQITLLPNMETGTATKTPDTRVMQALENLSDTQVNDFLTGRAPLLLAMKLGDHMMFVQLQLSTSSSSSSCGSRRSCFHQPASSPCNHGSQPTSHRFSQESHSERSAGSPPIPPPSIPHTNPTSGAVIESIQHIGKGVYSGTFSGTLDPTTPRPVGTPRRDISTILYILNDLLEATPQLKPQQQVQQPVRQPFKPIHMKENPQVTRRASSPVEDNSALKGKVQHLQRLLEERKMHRRMRRGSRSFPYSLKCRSPVKHERVFGKQFKFESTPRRDQVVTSQDGLQGAESGKSFVPPASSSMEHESLAV